MTAITRYRADTYPVRRRITDGSDPIDLTGYTFRMAVNRRQDPGGTANQLALITGTLDSPATEGYVSFSFDFSPVLEPGSFFYEIEMVDAAGYVRTIEQDSLTIIQDIAK